MKKLFTAGLCLALGLTALSGTYTKKAAAAEDSWSATDWMPFNYVLTSGAGSNMKYNDVRTSVSFDGNKVTASGRTTKGGMGVSFLPEIDITNFSLNVSLNSWQVASSDRWFGYTFMDVLVKEDKFNEVPFYSKHSETWSNDYGAGVIVAVRPRENGDLQTQFNTVGIKGTFNADGVVSADAGKYSDGELGWGGYIASVQLYNPDWSLKTDYNDLKLTSEGIYEGGKLVGIAFNMNDGYWKRSDWNWAADDNALGLSPTASNLESDVFDMLDLDDNGYLNQAEKDNFVYGPAWNDGEEKNSVIPYLNYGDPFTCLVNFENNLKANGKRLYMSYMYKDAFDIREGSPDAKFTINSVNGKAASKGESYNPAADKQVSGTVSATVKENNFHAGVLPGMINEIKAVDAAADSYKEANSAILAKANKKEHKVINFKGVIDGGKEVAIIDTLKVTYDLSAYSEAELYKVTGSDLDPISVEGGKATFNVGSSSTTYVIVYKGAGKKKGCGGAAATGTAAAIAIVALGAAMLKKKEN